MTGCYESKGQDNSVVNDVNNEKKSMAFLRKIGKVGGAANKDFANAMGVDEGPAGKAESSRRKVVKKAKHAYTLCTVSGVVDDLSEQFPFTSSGNQWSAFTDTVMGGKSNGSLSREEIEGKSANVLRGHVSLANNGGFIQMATDMALDPSVALTVDASDFDGIELDVLHGGSMAKESFNVHIKNSDCLTTASYRATFDLEKGNWLTIRLPWSEFSGHGPGLSQTPMNISIIRRIGVVAIGKEMDVCLALGGVRFYSVI